RVSLSHPRFIPGNPTGRTGTGRVPNTTQVPDASKITPPVAAKGQRAGHDIDVTVNIDAGVPILKIDSKLHEVTVTRNGKERADVELKNKKEIPNKDFVLSYLVAGDKVRSGFLSHKDGKEGYVTVIIIPPKKAKANQIAPKEMIFVIDCSGSQSGKPLNKAKETMDYAIDHMNPNDTFNIIDFSSGTRMLFSEPKKNTPENRAKAKKYLKSLRARGGTWMGPAVEKVCQTPAPENRLRIVTFMTDGYVGNDMEIIALVKKLRGKSRWFPFGTGNSVNRFLLDNMAKAGGGEVEYILLNTAGKEVAKKFYDRISTPVLTDISLSTEGIKLEEIYPGQVADLWARKPLVFKARYSKPGKGKITIKGFRGGIPYEQSLNVTLPEKQPENAAVASLWARAKVDDLMAQDFMGVQRGRPNAEIKEKIIRVALAHRIMTQFTSFVAVEDKVVTEGGKPVKVTVPVELPDGVSRRGVFGEEEAKVSADASRPGFARPAAPPGRAYSGKRGRLSLQSASPRQSRSEVARKKLKRKDGRVSRRPSSAPVAAKEQIAAEPRKVGELRDETKKLEKKSDKKAEKDKLEDPKSEAISPKLAPELRSLIELGDTSDNYALGKVQVEDGKVTIKVTLEKTNDKLMKKLKELGLEVLSTKDGGKILIGKIRVDKLVELVKVPEVKRVDPAPAK
ncbi:VWA domain-containing protein, partial [Thermodesulfobacteriota bacterium]